MSVTWLKAAGALCILASAAAFGEIKARSLAARVRHLQQFQQSLGLLSAEVSFTRTPLPEAFEQVAGQVDRPVGELYRAAAGRLKPGSRLTPREAWQASVREILPQTCFSPGDGEIVASLGVSLGSGRQEDQLRQIQLVARRLESVLPGAMENKLRGERMWRYLGALGGAALVILLL